MINILLKHDRFKDIFNLKESEVRISILLSVIMMFLLWIYDVYGEFQNFIGIIQSILGTFSGGLIGIVGFTLSGIAIILGLFNKKQIEIIEKINGIGSIEKLMSSFAFLAFQAALSSIILAVLSIALSCNKPIVPEWLFYVIAFCVIYIILFCLFYTVSLVFNCIKLFSISKLYKHTSNDVILPMANEVRIDFILSILVKICNLSKEDLLAGLRGNTEGLTEKEKEQLERYFKQYYK